MSEEVRKVRCNWCMAVFLEEDIIVTGEIEHCPKCCLVGYLMDIDVKAKQLLIKEVTNDKL